MKLPWGGVLTGFRHVARNMFDTTWFEHIINNSICPNELPLSCVPSGVKQTLLLPASITFGPPWGIFTGVHQVAGVVVGIFVVTVVVASEFHQAK